MELMNSHDGVDNMWYRRVARHGGVRDVGTGEPGTEPRGSSGRGATGELGTGWHGGARYVGEGAARDRGTGEPGTGPRGSTGRGATGEPVGSRGRSGVAADINNGTRMHTQAPISTTGTPAVGTNRHPYTSTHPTARPARTIRRPDRSARPDGQTRTPDGSPPDPPAARSPPDPAAPRSPADPPSRPPRPIRPPARHARPTCSSFGCGSTNYMNPLSVQAPFFSMCRAHFCGADRPASKNFFHVRPFLASGRRRPPK